MTRPAAPRRDRSSGQALTEFALVAPVLFLLFFGIIQFGFLLGGQNALVNGIRDAARYASTYRVTDSAQALSTCTVVRTQLSNNLRAGLPAFVATRLHPTVKYVWYANPDGVTNSVRIELSATYDHPLFVPLVGFIVDRIDGVADNALTLTASEQMRVENPALTSNGGTVTCP